jgi:hypothetical protein
VVFAGEQHFEEVAVLQRLAFDVRDVAFFHDFSLVSLTRYLRDCNRGTRNAYQRASTAEL